MLARTAQRKITTLTASLLLVAPLVVGGHSASATSTAAAPVTISIWTHTHPPMVAEFKKLIAAYEKLHPNVTVQYQIIPNMDFA
ncbi:MAG: hypothetical protein JWO42_34, partial [Chloroflexi bacterium]|nr:hypothetical protein [Chloroflexota bacterium]